jgi:hypothetical protein
MTKESAPPIITICPTCGNALECESTKDQWGMLHPLLPMSDAQKARHAECDPEVGYRALTRSAYHLSHVTVYKIAGD